MLQLIISNTYITLYIYTIFNRFIRTNMTEVISEKVELTKLEEEYDTVMQQIAILQQENMNLMNKLKELERNESNSEENSEIAGLSNDTKIHESD